MSEISLTDLRQIALHKALFFCGPNNQENYSPEEVVAVAQVFFEFLSSTSPNPFPPIPVIDPLTFGSSS